MTDKNYETLSKACEVDDQIVEFEFELKKAKSTVLWLENKIDALRKEKAKLSEELMKSSGIKTQGM